jgi:hypothetical protein
MAGVIAKSAFREWLHQFMPNKFGVCSPETFGTTHRILISKIIELSDLWLASIRSPSRPRCGVATSRATAASVAAHWRGTTRERGRGGRPGPGCAIEPRWLGMLSA